MHYTSREKRKHPEDWGGLLLPLDFFEVWILDLSETHCRWMHFWNGGHLRSAPVSRQGTKKRRENWEKEYVSGSGYKQKPTYNRSRKKRGHPSTHWDYCFETRHHIGNLGLLFWNAPLAFLAQQLQHRQCNLWNVRKTTFSTVGAYSTHPCILISRKCENVARKKERIFCFLICLRKKWIFLIFPLSLLSESGLVD